MGKHKRGRQTDNHTKIEDMKQYLLLLCIHKKTCHFINLILNDYTEKAFNSLEIHGRCQELTLISSPLPLGEHCVMHVQTHRQNNMCSSCLKECQNLGRFYESMDTSNINAKVPWNHPHPCSWTHPTHIFSLGKAREVKEERRQTS